MCQLLFCSWTRIRTTYTYFACPVIVYCTSSKSQDMPMSTVMMYSRQCPQENCCLCSVVVFSKSPWHDEYVNEYDGSPDVRTVMQPDHLHKTYRCNCRGELKRCIPRLMLPTGELCSWYSVLEHETDSNDRGWTTRGLRRRSRGLCARSMGRYGNATPVRAGRAGRCGRDVRTCSGGMVIEGIRPGDVRVVCRIPCLVPALLQSGCHTMRELCREVSD